jgi:hypothetical protein
MFSQQYEMNEDEGPVGFWFLILLKFKKNYVFRLFLHLDIF